MLTVQSTQILMIEKRIRHADILKYKIQYIQSNKDLFEFLFVHDWRAKDYRIWNERGRMPPKKEDWSVAAIELGKVIKELFNYHPLSDPKQVMFHFRRLYFKLYPVQKSSR